MSDGKSHARRTVLTAGMVGLSGTILGACGSKNASEGEGGVSAAPKSSAAADANGEPLLASSEVPVGGGIILPKQKLVVTQPTSGSFRCFSAVCTHARCLLNKVENGTIDCPCHGSKFSIDTGTATQGPATEALAEKKVSATSGQIFLA
ncbi:Rieske (2Fe-2S) protein [Streptomyces sp. NPDC059985]|uniref:Rieske (2Fe-2S) protein n=1 Tax=Streptomyces sp. NPDC059985 TaxID=3347025 RepID=UPI0036CB3EF2